MGWKDRIPPSWRTTLRHARLRSLDLFHNLASGSQSALPPPSLRTVGGGDFLAVGANNVRNLKRLTALDGKALLEIGCGSGRNALALTTYDVRYCGVDIYKPYIDWCCGQIVPHFPNFTFLHADLYNGEYNPGGPTKANVYTFPLPAESFDLIFLTSVFTHMLKPEVQHYVAEIARMLKAGGNLYLTAFLVTDEARELIAAGRSTQRFTLSNGHFVVKPDLPEAAVGYEEPILLDELRSHGLKVEAVKYGSWCGRKNYFDYQDVIFARRSEN